MNTTNFLVLFYQFLLNFLGILQFFIFLVVIFSWFSVPQNHPIVRFISAIGMPPIRLAKKITPSLGMIDLSPLVAFFAIDVFRYFLNYIFLHVL